MKLHSEAFANRVAGRIKTKVDTAQAMLASADADVVNVNIPIPSQLLGIPSILIVQVVSALIPLFIKCFKPDDGDQVKQFLSARYKEGTYINSVLTPAARRAKQAAEQNGGLLAYKVAVEFAIATLDEARTMDTQELSVIIREQAV